MMSIEQSFRQSPYDSYAYSYPHKTAYRAFERPVSLVDAWANERKDALFLYLHVPFCEMRCGFCNLFTTANPQADVASAYIDAMLRQAREVSSLLGECRFTRLAFGGGTPTFLDATALDRLCDIAEQVFGCDLAGVPASCETSPYTADQAKLQLLRDRGIDRISIGVQSFVEAEAGAVGRSQKTNNVEQALERIREIGFPVLNIDLMYGLPGQTVKSWLASLECALRIAPEELYLYPLYVRPLTGMGRQSREWDDIRLACYREGTLLLSSLGYEQVSMRMFRSGAMAIHDDEVVKPVYCCQDDGMVGLGCGARSYTQELHYCSEYAVGANGIREIIESFIESPRAAFNFAEYGFRLSGDEQRRRFVIKSVLRTEGLDLDAYRERFGNDPQADLPQLSELLLTGLAVKDGRRFNLSAEGMELSDAIAPWLYSTSVHELMKAYELR
jgi:oxygen-independent coproporphyrinogen-3 oxidase